ncbi:SigE family RNA polymerase sigma factor [Actinomadura sp. HBU206391]|uniref:SigE family RNA polymerase sigma factor n=1 Tax=Actinomadura sp. HBU206391 TaxID=2731692 RepID=UPI00164F17F8|nr:SigE family RNA polymerase sigma factor [Actinomadura sp. HBU206391]MBC6456408.1 SigE family RNA polymerase sigma factor [Actinomadura sp. HBU206391]
MRIPVGFEEFLTARLPALLRFATALVGDPHRAEDVVQDVLIRAQGRWRRISAMDAPEAYLKRMIINEYLSWRRRRSSQEVPAAEGLLDAAIEPEDDPARRYEQRDALWSGMAVLPPRQRAVLALRYYEGMSTAEIADILGCSETTVRSHASRALAELRLDSGGDLELQGDTAKGELR